MTQSTRELWFARGRERMAASAPVEAAAAFREMVAAAPGDRIALLSLGSALLAAGELRDAETVLRDATLAHPDFAGAWASLAVALTGQRRIEEALASARNAVTLAPGSVAACQVFSALAIQSGNAAQAVEVCKVALTHAAHHPVILASLADALKASGARDEAMAVLAPLVAQPQPPAGALVSYGALCLELGRFAEARDALERAVALDPRNPRAFDNLGTVRKRTGDLEGARDAYARAAALDPRLTPALCNLVDILRILCDWSALPDVLALRTAQQDGDPRWPPFIAVRDDTSAAGQQRIARRWSQATLPPAEPRAPAILAARGTPLRVGYLSADLQEHATARLMAGLFERHDRTRIETFAYSYGRDDASPMRARLRRAFAHWREIGHLDDRAAARAIREDGIDVLVELKGHTQDSRLGILSHRPAPAQVHYLGYPGTLGFAGATHLVADAIIVPPGAEVHYDETVLRMPACYQVNDDRRALPAATKRSALGLPDDAIVLASFNQTYKLSREFLRLWIEPMRAAPRSVLWLYAPNDTARRNLAAEAQAAGLPPGRLVFADAVANDAHLARLRAVDLVLDVLPCGSHTTGSDALWAGIPMLSCAGATFAGRVGASLLHAADLADLVVDSTQAYRDKLAHLLRAPEALREYKHHLETRRASLALFDTAAFTRAFERLMEGVATRD